MDKSLTKGQPLSERVLVFGNSGSGKSTFAKNLNGLAHLDLDSVAWSRDEVTTRLPLDQSFAMIDTFINQHEYWVIEGCYASLLEHAAGHATQMYFLNLSIDDCVENCRRRPWEPHKYSSKEAQDQNLSMLIEWVKQYRDRVVQDSEDDFSYTSHRKIFDQFTAEKFELTANRVSHCPSDESKILP